MIMKEPTIKIFVSYKNRHQLIKSDIIQPIQTGRAIADEIFEDMIGDDTGDNISRENYKYNELTAQYWVWKNYDKIGNPDYVGFMHYRRHFLFDSKKIRPKEKWLPNSNWYQFERIDKDYLEFLEDKKIKQTIKGYDCVISKAYDYSNYIHKTLIEDYKNLYMQKIEHFYLMLKEVKENYPEYTKTVEDVQHGCIKYIANMFIMNKKMFFDYSNFLFTIETKLNEKIDCTGYTEDECRFLGFLGEILLTIFILQNKKNYKIKEIDTSFILNTKQNQTKIYPAFNKNNIAVAMSSSNEYVPYLSVCLQSLLETAKPENNYDFIIFEHTITEENKIKLKKQIERNNISLRFVNPIDLLKTYKLSYSGCYSIECYFRLVAPIILSSYNKIIFTDVDLVFLTDVAELFNTNISNFPLAACQDFMWGAFLNLPQADWKKYATDTLKLKNKYDYFNTGVMILNIKEFNKNDYSRKILKKVSETQYRILEQDGLNAFFQNKIKYLDTAWNFPIANIVYKTFLNFMPYTSLKKYKKDKQHPNIIHYAGGRKPWACFNEDMAEIWWNYARKTPFYEEILLRMMQYNLGQINQNNTIIKSAFHYSRDKLKYWRYKLLSKITWGKKRKKYKQKRKALKSQLKQIKSFLNS